MARYGLYVDESIEYPGKRDLFRPDVAYPEYPFSFAATSASKNAVYEAIRNLLVEAGLDSDGFGTSEWNPLGAYVRPGDKVLVKPNLVMDVNPSGQGTDCLYTHPSVISAVIDYVVIALKGEGSITLADAPMQTCDFENLAKQSGLLELVNWYRGQGVDIALADMRGLRSTEGLSGPVQEVVKGAKGYVIDLGEDSSFHGLSDERIDALRITNYDPDELKRHHAPGKHEYFVSSHLLDADVVVNVPKGKTHRKAGITGALKNMVGVNVRKEYLPHHTFGSKVEGADEYRIRSIFRIIGSLLLDSRNRMLGSETGIARMALGMLASSAIHLGKLVTKDGTSEGNWFGNDTIWRTVLDLNKIVRYADRGGVMQDVPQRRMVVFTDMVVIGQGEGPLLPAPGKWGMLSFSDSPLASDIAMAGLMGADFSLIPCIDCALSYGGRYKVAEGPEADIVCQSNDPEYDGKPIKTLNEDGARVARPSKGWNPAFRKGMTPREESRV